MKEQSFTDLTISQLVEQSLGMGKVPLLTLENTFTHSQVEYFIKSTIAESIKAFLEFIEKHTAIKDKEGNPLPTASIDLDGGTAGKFQSILYAALEKHGIKMIKEQDVQGSDTTGDAQRTKS